MKTHRTQNTEQTQRVLCFLFFIKWQCLSFGDLKWTSNDFLNPWNPISKSKPQAHESFASTKRNSSYYCSFSLNNFQHVNAGRENHDHSMCGTLTSPSLSFSLSHSFYKIVPLKIKKNLTSIKILIILIIY